MDEAPYVSTQLVGLCLLIMGGGITIGFIIAKLTQLRLGRR